MECWDVGDELGKACEEVHAHCPGVDVRYPLLEHGRNLVLACDDALFVRVTEFIGPEEVEVGAEELPELVVAVMMLSKDEPFPNTWPKRLLGTAIEHKWQ